MIYLEINGLTIEQQVDKIKTMMQTLISTSTSINNLDELVSEDLETFETKDKAAAKQISDIIEAIATSIKAGVSRDSLLLPLKDEFQVSKFWILLEKILDNIIETYRDSVFLREKTDDQVKLFFRELMDNQIIIYDKISQVSEQLNNVYSEEDINNGVSILEHIITLVIIHRFSYLLFEENVDSVFGFNKKICEFLWDLINRNKDELSQRYILKNIYELKRKGN